MAKGAKSFKREPIEREYESDGCVIRQINSGPELRKMQQVCREIDEGKRRVYTEEEVIKKYPHLRKLKRTRR